MSKASAAEVASRLSEVRQLFGRKQSEIVNITGLSRTTVQSYLAMVRAERGTPTAADIAAVTRNKIDEFVDSIGLDNASPRKIVKSLGVSPSQANRALYRLRRETRLRNAEYADAKLAATDRGLYDDTNSIGTTQCVIRRPVAWLFQVIGDELICVNREPRSVKLGNYIGEVCNQP